MNKKSHPNTKILNESNANFKYQIFVAVLIQNT